MTTSKEVTSTDSIYPMNNWHGLADPRGVVRHLTMSIEEKRALLASWASDARGVPDPDYPALRRLDNGSLVEIDDILDAVKQFDGLSASAGSTSRIDRSHRKGHWSRLGRLWRRGRDDDDDDDPSTPAPAAPWPHQPILAGNVVAAA